MATGGEVSTRIYTRTGDRGETGLAGGVRIGKDSPRLAAYGALDELGAFVAFARLDLPEPLRDLAPIYRRLGHELFIAQTELARAPGHGEPEHRIEARHVERLEREIDHFTELAGPIHTFLLPGETSASVRAHLARTVARRAERAIVALHRQEPVRAELLQWINRVNDLLFVLAVYAARKLGGADEPPDYSV